MQLKTKIALKLRFWLQESFFFLVYVLVIVVETSSLIQCGVLCNVL